MIVLRDYQQDLIDRTRLALRRHKSVCVQAPTGAGKTAISAKMMGTASSKGLRSFFICHREELIEQTSETFKSVGIDHGFCAAGRPFNPWFPVLVCSINTLKNRLDRLPLPGFTVWDECHHIAAAGWTKVRTHFDQSYHVGLTATPERLDGRGLDDKFGELVPGPPVAWLIENGFLCEYKAFSPPGPDLSGVRKSMGDYSKADLEEVMDGSSVMGDTVRHYQRHARGKRAVAFCVSVKHSEHVAEQFRAKGHVAVSLDGKTDRYERKRALDAFRKGEIEILCNVDLFGEGFDLPAIEAAILLRPTQSLTIYLQQVGRALRTFPGKKHAVILDHAGNIAKHGLPDDDRVWSLEGRKKNKSAVELMVCPECFAHHSPRPRCPECNFAYAQRRDGGLGLGRSIREVEGDLQEIDKAALRAARVQEQGMAQSLEDLIRLGTARGMKSPEKWAAHVITARIAKRPPRPPLPEEPPYEGLLI